MPWFLDNMNMLDAMADIAGDPEKLAAYKEAPREYLAEYTDLDEETVDAITNHDHEAVVKALMSKVGDDGDDGEDADG